MDQRIARIGVGVLVWREGKVALIKRTGPFGPGTWAPPGGHLEFGELALDAARRETREEIGVEIDNLEILGITEDISEEYGTHYITIWIQSDLVSGELKASDVEFTESGFFDLSHPPGPLFIPFKNLLEGKLTPRRCGELTSGVPYHLL